MRGSGAIITNKRRIGIDEARAVASRGNRPRHKLRYPLLMQGGFHGLHLLKRCSGWRMADGGRRTRDDHVPAHAIPARSAPHYTVTPAWQAPKRIHGQNP